jgi:hypothetical protein
MILSCFVIVSLFVSLAMPTTTTTAEQLPGTDTKPNAQICKCFIRQLDAGRFSGENGALARCLRELKKLLMYVCRRIVGP